jgi:hypothetical protein
MRIPLVIPIASAQSDALFVECVMLGNTGCHMSMRERILIGIISGESSYHSLQHTAARIDSEAFCT